MPKSWQGHVLERRDQGPSDRRRTARFPKGPFALSQRNRAVGRLSRTRGSTIHIEYIHASKFGNGLLVAEHFARLATEAGSTVHVQHVRSADPTDLAEADLYVFSSPGRMGRPIKRARRFLTDVSLPPGTEYALLTTEAAPQSATDAAKVPAATEPDPHQRVRPIMHEILRDKGLVPRGEQAILVSGAKGPLQEGWEQDVEHFVAAIATPD